MQSVNQRGEIEQQLLPQMVVFMSVHQDVRDAQSVDQMNQFVLRLKLVLVLYQELLLNVIRLVRDAQEHQVLLAFLVSMVNL